MNDEIWIADDDADDVFFYREALVQLNIPETIRTFGDGRTLWQALQEKATAPPRLLILDGHMPQMSGPEVIRQLSLAPMPRNCHVVLVTGTLSPAERAFMKDCGVPVYRKPATAADLLTLMRNLLAARD